jgi:predicted nucleic acid-binding protein
MILVDTSVWIDHFRRLDERLARYLEEQKVVTHPFILGETALGHLKPRRQILFRMARLPKISVASDSEVLTFVEAESLYGSGIGYVDTHLLASAKLTPGTAIWTRDKTLRAAAEKARAILLES